MKKYFLILFLFVLASSINANNIKVEDVKYDKSSKKVSFKISWENAWRQTSDFHDAAWVFCKYKTVNTGRWLHTDIKANSTKTSGALETKETTDKLGFFVRFKTDSTGHILPTEVSFDAENIVGIYPDFKVFAIEMVYVPEGRFYAGAPKGINHQIYGDIDLFYQTSVFTNFTEREPLLIASESKLINTQLTRISISGQPSDAIPANFPKGYGAFYCMKHEISNDQLVQFFNNADFSWVSKFGLIQLSPKQYLYKNIYKPGNTNDTIKIIGNMNPEGFVFTCDSKYQYYPAIMSPLTLTNYLGWTGLAPMTELQFEKACRGPLYPVEEEVAGGVSKYVATYVSDTAFKNLYTENEQLKQHQSAPYNQKLNRCGYAADSSTNRLTSNATFYGILNMSDNVTEITVSLQGIDTNQYFTGDSRKTESFINTLDFYFNAYILRPLAENDVPTNVIYKRGDENGINNTYNAYDMTKISKNVNGEFSILAGGRGVRKPD